MEFLQYLFSEKCFALNNNQELAPSGCVTARWGSQVLPLNWKNLYRVQFSCHWQDAVGCKLQACMISCRCRVGVADLPLRILCSRMAAASALKAPS
jgi:hypothetical protein